MKRFICEASTKETSKIRTRTRFIQRKRNRNLLDNLVIPKFDIDSKYSLFPSKKLPFIKQTFFEFNLKKSSNKYNIQSSLF